jgi:oligopeptide transport system substrate-binding protein
MIPFPNSNEKSNPLINTMLTAIRCDDCKNTTQRLAVCFIFHIIFFISIAYADNAVNMETGRIALSLKAEPPTLNSLISTDQVSTFVLSHIMEGLLQYGPDNKLAPGVAERWELRPDGATFWLRRNARWSDGRPVVAKDFVFAWQTAVSPKTASQYAFILFPIENAEAINKGNLPAEQLGVEAVGDYELRVKFSGPCPYFLGLTAFPTYYPVREDIYRKSGDRYAADKEDLIVNGAFTVSKWIHGAHLQLQKNPFYWQKDRIRLNTIDMPYVTSDNSANFNLYKAGSIAFANLTVETLPAALERGDSLYRFATGSVYFIEFNFRDSRITCHLEIRKAIQSIIDTRVLVNKVLALPGILPGESLFPVTVNGNENSFRQEFPAPLVEKNLKQAQRYLLEMRRKAGIEKIPPLVLLVNDSPLAARQAEYLQYLLKRALDLDVQIDKQVFKQYLQKMKRGDFDLTLAGWGPDYDDVMTYAELMASWNENNRGKYKNHQYDEILRKIMLETDNQKRMGYFSALQKILTEDVPIIPLYENAEIYVQHPLLKGVLRNNFGGDPNYRYAWLEKP